MEDITFTDNETKYYGDVFTHLDSEGKGSISLNQFHEFLRASKLSSDLLSQIGQLSGGIDQGCYGRKEAFIALKLVAAAQRGLPVRAESLSLGVDLPLPRLHTNNNTHYENNLTYSSKEYASSPDLIQLSDSDCNTSQMVDGGYRMMDSEEGEGADERMSDPSGRMMAHSPSVSSPASDSPTPTNSVHEKSWSQAHTHWHGLINDEHRQLLGTEEDSSDHQSSDDEDYDVWTITDEQRQYYTDQFRSMQGDLTALLSGNDAKEFFEKSKLPVNELSKIWHLADVTRDGALSLEEFFIAMHLVVLRRNHIELPETLPASLNPLLSRSGSSGGETGNCGASGNSSVVAIAPSVTEVEPGTKTPDPLSPSKNKEASAWTKFVDSPTSTSPGLKPVNFDFQKSAVEQDPKILHPKALRLTPESKRLDVPDGDGPASFSPETTITPNNLAAPVACSNDLPPSNSSTTSPPSQPSPKKTPENQEIKPIQRPLPRKPPGSGTGVLPPPPQASVGTPPDDNGMYGPTSLPMMPSAPLPGGKKEPPPPPPPRPTRTHIRSSSLDLNKFSRSTFLGAPPAVPPRASPGASSPKKLIYQKSDGDMANTEECQEDASCSVESRSGMEHARTSAFEIYRKPNQEVGSAFERVSSQRGEEEDRVGHLSTGARTWQKMADTLDPFTLTGELVYKIYRARRTTVSKVHRDIQKYEKSGAGADERPKVSTAADQIWQKWNFLAQGISHRDLDQNLENLEPLPGSVQAKRKEERAKKPAKKRPRKKAPEDAAEEEATVDDVLAMHSSGSEGGSTSREEQPRAKSQSPVTRTLLELTSALKAGRPVDPPPSSNFDPDVKATIQYLRYKLQSWSPRRRKVIELKLLDVVIKATRQEMEEKKQEERREREMTQPRPGTSYESSPLWQPQYHYHHHQQQQPYHQFHQAPGPSSTHPQHFTPGPSPRPSPHPRCSSIQGQVLHPHSSLTIQIPVRHPR